MELKICEGDFGLASMDSECLQLILLVKAAKVPTNINYKTSKFPVLLHNNNKPVKNYSKIKDYLNAIGYSADYSLTGKQISESYVLINMLRYQMTPIMKYIWWADPFNCEEFSSKWFMKSRRIPFNLISWRIMKNEADLLLEVRYPNANPEKMKKSVMNDLIECLANFAARLNKTSYLFGNEISSVDITLYGYLAPLLKVPFPNTEYKSVVRSWPVLVKFVERIDRTYFPELEYTEKYISSSVFDEDLDKNAGVVFFIGFLVTVLMVGYAMSNRIFASK